MLTFRFATIQDCPLILDFIKELADYEKMLDEVIATEELLGVFGHSAILVGKHEFHLDVTVSVYLDMVYQFGQYTLNWLQMIGFRK